jgi:hypothetical protein
MRPPIDEPIAENPGWTESDLRLRDATPRNPDDKHQTLVAERPKSIEEANRNKAAGTDAKNAGQRSKVNRGQE